jgi:superfamily II DNA or RNA helicase
MTFSERDYQTRAHVAIFEMWKKHRSTLIVLPTGGGKTIVFAHVIASCQPKRAMVLAHRDELIVQAKEKIEAVTGLSVEIEKADLYASMSLYHRMPVVVSSIQTQISGPKDKRRYLRFNPMDFGVLICDEAHHSLSKSWKEVIAHYQKNPDLKLLGVTATPDRSDQKAMGQIFESVAFQYEILDAIHDGWLVDITQQFVPVTSLDFSHVRTTAGDLNEGDLSRVMETEENIQGICQPSLEVMFGLAPKTLSAIPVPGWREYLVGLNRKPRRTIVFTVSVAQAEMCANIFSRAIDGVEWVCGATNKDKRRAILSRFSKGETHAVVNCGVLLEGFDNPGVEVVVMARPTKSRALYAQAIGRSTRPLPGIVDGFATAEERRKAIAESPKPYCRILDFVGNSGKHKLVSCADVLGGKISDEAREASKAKAIRDGKPVRIMVTMDNAEQELERKKQEAAEKARQERESRKRHLMARVEFGLQDVDPFGDSDSRVTHRTMSRDGKTFSEKQTGILRGGGVNPSNVGYRQGQAIIAKLLSKPSPKMDRVLRNKGYDPTGWDRKKAKAVIDALAANGWRRPEMAQ